MLHNSLLAFLEVFFEFGVLQVRGPSNPRSVLFFHSSSSDGWLQTLISLSWHPNVGIAFNLSNSESTSTLASGIFKASWTEHMLLRQCSTYVVASLFCMLLHFLNLIVPHCRQSKLWLPSAAVLLHARHCGSCVFSSFRRASTITLKLLRRAACNFSYSTVHYATYFPFIQTSCHILSGLLVFQIFVGSPFSTCPTRSVVRKIRNLQSQSTPHK